LERAAALLADSGFRIVRIGRFGVSVAAEQQTFESALGVSVEPGQSSSVEAVPQSQELADLVDRVDVASAPESF
jgi:hypothetical protein